MISQSFNRLCHLIAPAIEQAIGHGFTVSLGQHAALIIGLLWLRSLLLRALSILLIIGRLRRLLLTRHRHIGSGTKLRQFLKLFVRDLIDLSIEFDGVKVLARLRGFGWLFEGFRSGGIERAWFGLIFVMRSGFESGTLAGFVLEIFAIA